MKSCVTKRALSLKAFLSQYVLKITYISDHFGDVTFLHESCVAYDN